jgi:vancomycin permeability regulator SanA
LAPRGFCGGRKKAVREKAMRMNAGKCWIILITVLLINAGVSSASAEDQHSVHEKFRRHHVGLLLGNTEEGHENGFTIGADYEYRQKELIGLGGVTEYIGGDFDSFVLAGLVFYTPL